MADSLQDILSAARTKLISDPDFASLIGAEVGTDLSDSTLYSGSFSDGWVFYGVGDELVPERNPANTGTSTVSLGMREPWTTPNDHNTMSFRVLSFVILSDPTRVDAASSGLLVTRDAENKCYKIAKAIEKVFNNQSGQDVWWPGGVFVISSLLYREVLIRDVLGQDGMVRGDIRFKLILG